MNRHPIPHKQDPAYRVISVYNNRWVAQHHDGSEGTRDHDPWYNLHRPTPSQDRAIEVMYSRKPMVRGG